MLLKDTHDHTKKYQKYNNWKNIIVLYLFPFSSFFSKNLSTFLHLVISSFHSFNNLSLSPVTIWNFSQRNKLHFFLRALYGVPLLITDHLISKLCFLFFVSQVDGKICQISPPSAHAHSFLSITQVLGKD